MAENVNYEFYSKFAKILNSGQSRSVVLCGNIYDLYWDGTEHVQLIPFLMKRTAPSSHIKLVYELNGPIRVSDADKERIRVAWVKWKTGLTPDEITLKNMKADLKSSGPSQLERIKGEVDQYLMDSIGNPGTALEFMRQLCICARSTKEFSFLIFVSGADMMLPVGSGDVSSLSDAQFRRVCVCQDWFSDPAFINGNDLVCLIAESKSSLNPRIAKMPQLVSVEIPFPNEKDRGYYIDCFIGQMANKPENKDFKPWTVENISLPVMTAGLSLYALRQLLMGAYYDRKPLSFETVNEKVAEFITAQAQDALDFKRPLHRLSDCVGNTKIKNLIKNELMRRIISTNPKQAISGFIVAGAIGGGKTFVFEAMAAELGIPVLVFKNIRSMWYGQTDVIFERIRRILEALGKCLMFVDEADTVFGGVGVNVHETERRLTGSIQGMMSDVRLKGKVTWCSMTARIHLLSADIRRPERGGDLIIPVLDPVGQDRLDFIKWALSPVVKDEMDKCVAALDGLLPTHYSAASYSSLRSYLVANWDGTGDTVKVITDMMSELMPSDIGLTREYQTLQALNNCTRRSLMPEGEVSEEARIKRTARIKELEAMGIS